MPRRRHSGSRTGLDRICRYRVLSSACSRRRRQTSGSVPGDSRLTVLNHDHRFCTGRHHGAGGDLRSLGPRYVQAGEGTHGHAARQPQADGPVLSCRQGVLCAQGKPSMETRKPALSWEETIFSARMRPWICSSCIASVALRGR
jgi:hypothetical protein